MFIFLFWFHLNLSTALQVTLAGTAI